MGITRPVAVIAASVVALFRSRGLKAVVAPDKPNMPAPDDVKLAEADKRRANKHAWKQSRPKHYRPKHNKKNYGGPKHRH